MKISPVVLLGLASTAIAGPLGQRDTVDNTVSDLKAIYSNNKCASACTFLSAVLWGKVSRPESSAYQTSQDRIWSSRSSDLAPVCVVAPTSALDVSVALLMMRTVSCPFVVRAGGHTPFAGGNSIENGVTIDLRNLNQVTIAADKQSVAIGPGNKWGQVYSKLDAAGLRVVGGRDKNVGVGGLMVGGGVSYFSGRYGFAVDNVINYQVVFADGTIREVNQESYPDVYKALRGGGNNFGIITRFDLNAYPGTDVWGGARRYAVAAGGFPSLIDAVVEFNINHSEDVDAAIILSYIWLNRDGVQMWLAVLNIAHGSPTPFPASLKKFTDVSAGLISDTFSTRTLTNLTTELGATTVNGLRQSMWTFTCRNDAAFLKQLAKIWEEEIEAIKGVVGILPALSYQIISEATISHMSKNGGNSLGLDTSAGPLILMNWAMQWNLASDDALVMGMSKIFYDRAIAAAKAAGVFHPYLYLNYADISLDVFAGYGAANKADLIATHQKWDKNGVFTTLQPGGFKIE